MKKQKKYNLTRMKKELMGDIKKLKAPRGFLWAGYPHYKALFGRDSLISAWQLLDIDPKIAEKTLKVLAELQGEKVNNKKEEEPGKILHEYRTPTDVKYWKQKFEHFNYWGFPYYGSCDSTPLFVIVAAKYFDKTKDKKFIKKIWPNIKKAVFWMENYGDVDGDQFIEYQRKNPWGLYHQGWKDSTQNHIRLTAPVALVEIQGYAYLAYKNAEKLALLFKDKKLAKYCSNKARVLKEKFNKVFWQDDFYILGLNRTKKKRITIASNQGHLLFTGIIDTKDKEKKLVKRLFQKDMWTPYGIRTLSSKDKYFNPLSYHLGSVWPHDNWFIWFGLKKYGYKKEAEKIKKALFRAYHEIGYIPEYFTVKKKIVVPYIRRACHPQAWASGALLSMLVN